MRNIFLTLGIIFSFVSFVQADSLYRWLDKEGRVHYGDRPAADAVNPEEKKFAAPATVSEDDLPYNVRKAKQAFPVTLYVAANCGDLCVQARSFLNQRGIPFAEKNLGSKEEIDDFKAKTGGNSVPALTIGKTFLSGFEAGQWNGELDTAGYPKTAPYGTRPVPPAATPPETPASANK